MADHSRLSGKYFNSGYCCAEAVLLEVSEVKCIQSELIPKIATGFCSGLAKTDSLCGALTGGILSINIVKGRETPEDDRETNYAMINKLSDFFRNEFGATYCTEVCGCNIATLTGSEEYQRENKKILCTGVVEKTAEYVLELLQE